MLPKWFLSVGLGVSCVTGASGEPAQPYAIFSSIPGSGPTSVPGLFMAEFDGFDRPFVSPDGSRWIMTADRSGHGSDSDELLIVGAGPTAEGAEVVLAEGMQLPWDGVAGAQVGTFGSRVAINDDGWFAFQTELGGAAPDNANSQVVRWDPVSGTFEVVAAEGGEIFGFPDNFFGNTLNSISITNGGAVGFHARSTQGTLFTNKDDLVILGDQVIAQEGVTFPQEADEPWNYFKNNGQYFDSTGERWLIQGDLDGGGGTVIVVDDQIVAHEGFALPGFDSPIDFGEPSDSLMLANGDWFARGQNEDDQYWMLRNGEAVALTGDPVPGSGGTEFYAGTVVSNTFISFTGNNRGDFVFVARTDNPNASADTVAVVNGAEVILREGDPVDVDGNGAFDDDLFIGFFTGEHMFLTDDGWLQFNSVLRTGGGQIAGEAYLALFVPSIVPAGCDEDLDQSGTVDSGDLNQLLAAFGAGSGGDIDGNGDTDSTDLNLLLAAFGDDCEE